MIDAIVRDLARLAGAGGQHRDLRRLEIARNRQYPLSVRRQPFRRPVAKPDGRRAVSAAEIDAEDRTARFARLRKDDGLAVRRKIAHDGVVEPGEIDRLGIAADADDAGANDLARD